jgi:hypothetical protein
MFFAVFQKCDDEINGCWLLCSNARVNHYMFACTCNVLLSLCSSSLHPLKSCMRYGHVRGVEIHHQHHRCVCLFCVKKLRNTSCLCAWRLRKAYIQRQDSKYGNKKKLPSVICGLARCLLSPIYGSSIKSPHVESMA